MAQLRGTKKAHVSRYGPIEGAWGNCVTQLLGVRRAHGAVVIHVTVRERSAGVTKRAWGNFRVHTMCMR